MLLAVFVHRDNPLRGLTLQQIDAIFSSTRKAGLDKPINTWGELGLSGAWADKPIVLPELLTVELFLNALQQAAPTTKENRT